MLQQKDDCSHRELGSKGGNETTVDYRCTDMLEATGNGLQDLDGIFSRVAHAMPAVQPRGDGEDDNDKRVTERRDEEERSLCRDPRLVTN